MKERELEKALKGLANRRRLSIIKFLSKEKELTVADLAERIHLSFKSTSKHLAMLHQLDMVERRQQGLNVYYSLQEPFPETLRALSKLISNSRPS